MKNIAVILSGSGHKDGSEITEATSVIIALGQQNSTYHCFAPSIDFESRSHLDNESTGTRNTLIESARICRGKINNLNELKAKDFDAMIFIGGYGAATILSNWKDQGVRCKVIPDCEKIIQEFHKEGKPIGALCIAPVLIAKVLGKFEITLTIGNDEATIKEIEKTGAVHETCSVDDYISDRSHKIVTSPAYMYDDVKASEVFTGISGLVKELVEMA